MAETKPIRIANKMMNGAAQTTVIATNETYLLQLIDSVRTGYPESEVLNRIFEENKILWQKKMGCGYLSSIIDDFRIFAEEITTDFAIVLAKINREEVERQKKVSAASRTGLSNLLTKRS